tara:strand:- start:1589 stop:2611 length:1023 start_codon:yes stop_codon:yes gene_type:complete
MKKTIVSYGEILLRISPQNHNDLIQQTNLFRTFFGGSEANILCSLSILGHDTKIISSLPNNQLGIAAKKNIQQHGVITNNIFLENGRIGTYYFQHGVSKRGAEVIYDRKNSCFSNKLISDEKWTEFLKDSSFFILSGITPALSEVCMENILNSIKIAKKLKVKIVFDFNYRRTLWPKDKASKFINKIIHHFDIVFGNLGVMIDLFNFKSNLIEDYTKLEKVTLEACKVLSNLGDFEQIGMTIRNQINANENFLGGLIKTREDIFISKPIKTRIIDRIGGGDAFVAGVLHGSINKWKGSKIIDFAVNAYSITQTFFGDINIMDENEILKLSSKKNQGHINR